MDGFRTTELTSRGLKESGIDRAWIGLNSWGAGVRKTGACGESRRAGYLIGSYDSLSLHSPNRAKAVDNGAV